MPFALTASGLIADKGELSAPTYTVTGENDVVTPFVPGDPNTPADPLNYIPAQTGTDSVALTPFDLTPFFTDADSTDTLTLSIAPADLPAGLSFDAATGNISGTPDADASQGGVNGVYTIPVTATDSNGSTIVTNVTYTVTNPAPVAVNDAFATNEDTPITVNILTGSDSDPDGDMIFVDGAALPDGTVIALNTPTMVAEGTVTINSDGSVTFDPAQDFNGTFVFGYTLSDSDGGTDVATVTFTVDPVNDTPVPIIPGDPNAPVDPTNYIPPQTAQDGKATTPLDLTPYFGDPDPAEPLVISLDPSDLPSGLVFDPATGVISGTPDADASTSGDPMNPGTYVIPVTVTDPSGESFTTSVTYTLTNPAPVAATDGTLPVVEDTPTVLTVLGNDVDPDGDDLTITEINGTPVAVGVPATLPSGAVVTLNGDGTVSYDPVADYTGPDSFDYTISDGEGGTDTATVNLEVTPVNDVPVVTPATPGEPALPAQSNDDGDTPSVDVSRPFSDVDGDPLTFTATGLPTGLTIDPVTGVISGTLPAGTSADGPFAVTVTATDSDGETVSTDFVWSVGNVAPEVVTPLPSVSFHDAADVSLPTAGSFTDPDGDDVTYTATGLTIDVTTGIISGTIDSSASLEGPYTLTVTATDSQGDQTSLTFPIAVENTAPIIDIGEGLAGGNLSPGSAGEPIVEFIVGLGEPTLIDIGALTIDPEGDKTLIFSVEGELPEGLLLDPETGVISGHPTIPSDVPYEFTIVVADDEGGQNTLILSKNSYGPNSI